MKKLTVLLLCISLLMTCTVTAYAAGTTVVDIIPSKSEVEPGDKITIEFQISGSETCTSFGLALEYDASTFEVEKGKSSLKGATLGVFDKEKGFAYLFHNGVIPQGTMGTVTMKVKDNASAGTFEVSGQLAVNHGEEKIPSLVNSASITVKSDAVAPETEQAAPPADSKPVENQLQQPDAQSPENEDVTTQIDMPNAEDKPQEQQVTVSQSEAVADTQPAAEQKSSARISPLLELGIAVVVLTVLIAALVICLVKISRKRKRQ